MRRGHTCPTKCPLARAAELVEWFPAEPLCAIVRRLAGEGVPAATIFGNPSSAAARAFYRAQSSGYLTPGMADELAARLDRHPSEIWPERW